MCRQSWQTGRLQKMYHPLFAAARYMSPPISDCTAGSFEMKVSSEVHPLYSDTCLAEAKQVDDIFSGA